MTNPGVFTFNGEAEKIAANRFHRISLFVSERDQRKTLACRIELFGGVLAATVQLTPAVPDAEYPDELVIDQTETVQF